MAHPFTLEYMQEGDIDFNRNTGDDNKLQEITQHGSMAEKNRISPSRTSTRSCEISSLNDECQINPAAEDTGALESIREQMNIGFDDTAEVGFLTILRMSMEHRLKTFAEEVSIVGFSYLFKHSSSRIGSVIRKAIWTMLLLFGAGFMVFQIYDRISYYHAYPTNVGYQVAYNRSLRFPTVTICSECLVSKKAFFSLGPTTREFVTVRAPPFYDIEFGDTFSALNFSQLDFDWEVFYKIVGIKAEDTMIECSFGNLPCNSTEAMKRVITDYGFCTSFNPDMANYVTTIPGAENGLRLALLVNQSDCQMLMSPGVGFKVVLHDPHDEPFVGMLGFRVGTGISTSVSVSLRNVSMLPSPYGDCRQSGNYSLMRCITLCMSEYMLSECKCRPMQINVAGKVCSIDKLYYCIPNVLKRFISSGAMARCDCPIQCYLPTYPYSISTSPLSQHFLNYMSKKSQFKGRNLTMSKLSKELAYLDIFYSQLSYVDVQTTPAYDFLTLVCDVSGALGLILGGTLLTIVEFSQFFVQLFNDLINSARFAKMQRR